jgi:hypothetical protein
MPLKIIMLAIALTIVTACTRSDEFKQYKKFMTSFSLNYNGAEEKYHALSIEEKISVYLGANEMHPSDRRVADLAFCQDYDFLVRLRSVLELRDDYVATYHFTNEVQFEHCNKKFTSEEIEALNLPGLCRSLTSQSETCLKLLESHNSPAPIN